MAGSSSAKDELMCDSWNTVVMQATRLYRSSPVCANICFGLLTWQSKGTGALLVPSAEQSVLE